MQKLNKVMKIRVGMPEAIECPVCGVPFDNYNVRSFTEWDLHIMGMLYRQGACADAGKGWVNVDGRNLTIVQDRQFDWWIVSQEVSKNGMNFQPQMIPFMLDGVVNDGVVKTIEKITEVISGHQSFLNMMYETITGGK